jgi:hypothetical protein
MSLWPSTPVTNFRPSLRNTKKQMYEKQLDSRLRRLEIDVDKCLETLYKLSPPIELDSELRGRLWEKIKDLKDQL